MAGAAAAATSADVRTGLTTGERSGAGSDAGSSAGPGRGRERAIWPRGHRPCRACCTRRPDAPPAALQPCFCHGGRSREAGEAAASGLRPGPLTGQLISELPGPGSEEGGRPRGAPSPGLGRNRFPEEVACGGVRMGRGSLTRDCRGQVPKPRKLKALRPEGGRGSGGPRGLAGRAVGPTRVPGLETPSCGEQLGTRSHGNQEPSPCGQGWRGAPSREAVAVCGRETRQADGDAARATHGQTSWGHAGATEDGS